MVSREMYKRSACARAAVGLMRGGVALCVAVLLLVLAACRSGLSGGARATPSPTDPASDNSIVPGRAELIRLLQAMPEGTLDFTEDGSMRRVLLQVDAPPSPNRPSEHETPASPAVVQPPALTLGTVLAELGDPEYAWGWHERGGEFLCQVVTLEYPARGLRVTGYTCWLHWMDMAPVDAGASVLRVDPGFPVAAIDYYPPTSLQRALRDVYHLNESETKCLLRKARWQGLGAVPAVAECRGLPRSRR